jgi:hypothetical protein
MALECKTTDELRITITFKSFRVTKINELVVTSNKLTNSFVGLLTSGLGPDVVVGHLLDHADICSQIMHSHFHCILLDTGLHI